VGGEESSFSEEKEAKILLPICSRDHWKPGLIAMVAKG
jgi:hypothetical protein